MTRHKEDNKTHVTSVRFNIRELALVYQLFEEVHRERAPRTKGGVIAEALSAIAIIAQRKLGRELPSIETAMRFLESRGISLGRPMASNLSRMLSEEDETIRRKVDISELPEEEQDYVKKMQEEAKKRMGLE